MDGVIASQDSIVVYEVDAIANVEPTAPSYFLKNLSLKPC